MRGGEEPVAWLTCQEAINFIFGVGENEKD